MDESAVKWLGVKATKAAWGAKVHSASQRLMLLAIAKYADEDCMAFPSVESLCADTCLNAKTAYKVLKELKELGVLNVEKRPTCNGNLYRIVRVGNSENGSTESGSTENGSTENGGNGTTKNGISVIPKTEHEEYQEKSKGKKEVVVPVSACEESALHPTIEDYGINPNEDKATSTVTSKEETPPQPRPLQGPSYIDPVPYDEIVAAYNRYMAHIGGKVKALDEAQAKAVELFWECLVIELWKTKDDEMKTRAGALEQIEHYFRHCAADGFINGTAKRNPDFKAWVATFDWLIREKTLRRMLSGGYAPSGAGKKEGR